MSIEESAPRTSELVWFKSSHSDGGGGECVEIAIGPAAVHVRDSKDKHGPRLSFTPAEWSAFVSYTAELG